MPTYDDFESDRIALETAGDIVESVAYNRAGSWQISHVTRLIMIAADLQRISREENPHAGESPSGLGY